MSFSHELEQPKQSHRSVWRVVLRLAISLTALSVFSELITISAREFAHVCLFGFAFVLLLWTVYGKYVRHVWVCVCLLVGLLIVPIDIVVSDSMSSTQSRHASVKLLQAQYGLSNRPMPDSYSLGCVVPPNELKWVLWVDVWPLLGQASEMMGK